MTNNSSESEKRIYLRRFCQLLAKPICAKPICEEVLQISRKTSYIYDDIPLLSKLMQTNNSFFFVVLGKRIYAFTGNQLQLTTKDTTWIWNLPPLLAKQLFICWYFFILFHSHSSCSSFLCMILLSCSLFHLNCSILVILSFSSHYSPSFPVHMASLGNLFLEY